MVKEIFNSFNRGFFYFIGKVVAILFIGFVIYTLVQKIDVPTDDIISSSNLPIYRGVIK